MAAAWSFERTTSLVTIRSARPTSSPGSRLRDAHRISSPVSCAKSSPARNGLPGTADAAPHDTGRPSWGGPFQSGLDTDTTAPLLPNQGTRRVYAHKIKQTAQKNKEKFPQDDRHTSRRKLWSVTFARKQNKQARHYYATIKRKRSGHRQRKKRKGPQVSRKSEAQTKNNAKLHRKSRGGNIKRGISGVVNLS